LALNAAKKVFGGPRNDRPSPFVYADLTCPTKSLSTLVLLSALYIESNRDKLAEASLLHEGRMARGPGKAVATCRLLWAKH
jgi:hypothetical protein